MPALSFAPMSRMSACRRPPWLGFCLCAKQVEAAKNSQWEPLFHCGHCHQLLPHRCRPLWHTFQCKQTRTGGWRNVSESTGATVFQAACDVTNRIAGSVSHVDHTHRCINIHLRLNSNVLNQCASPADADWNLHPLSLHCCSGISAVWLQHRRHQRTAEGTKSKCLVLLTF